MITAKKIVLPVLILLPLLMQNCAEVFQKSVANGQVILSAPVDGLVSADSVQVFYWQPITDAQSYELQIVSPKFDSIARFIADTPVNNNVFSLTLPGGQYQWRVRAVNSVSASPFSDPRSFLLN